MTTETLRALLQEYLGVELPDEEIERLLPVYERQLERTRELHALDLGGDDPRTMAYINDSRMGR